MKDIDIGINVSRCDECLKYDKAVKIYEMFDMEEYFSWLFKYDKENQTFLINENVLMNLIKIANPLQETRRFKLVDQEEWRKFDSKNICNTLNDKGVD